jgi:trehalose-phosphatase
LDYDGTLAPFQTDRHNAGPYPQVVPLLQAIAGRGRSRVVIVTGRPIVELLPLLGPLRAVEIWGSHGLEHQAADGTLHRHTVPPETAALLSQAESWLASAGLSDRTELKPGGIAVHWRGLPAADAERTHARTHAGLGPYSMRSGLKLLEFDGGLELRVEHPNKGDAVASVLGSAAPGTPAAYLGDDLTDEFAFRALNASGLSAAGLSVLVRPQYRKTAAQIWLQPPHELLGFLQQWLDCLSA